MKKLLFATSLTVGVILSATTFQSCYNDNEADLYGTTTMPTTCDTTGSKFSTFVSPLIKSKCAISGCHDAVSQSGGVNLSSYATIKSYISSGKSVLLGSINQSAGYSKMPKGSAKLADCDISKIEAWINGGLLNN